MRSLDPEIEQMKDCFIRLQMLAPKKDDLWFDLKAHLITANEFARRLEPINAEINETFREMQALEARGIRSNPIVEDYGKPTARTVGMLFYRGEQDRPPAGCGFVIPKELQKKNGITDDPDKDSQVR